MELANFDRETAIHTETATMTIIPLTTIEVLPLAMLATSGEILSHEFVTPKPTPKRLRKKNCGLSCETYPVAPASHVGARLLQEFEGYGCFLGVRTPGATIWSIPSEATTAGGVFWGSSSFLFIMGARLGL